MYEQYKKIVVSMVARVDSRIERSLRRVAQYISKKLKRDNYFVF